MRPIDCVRPVFDDYEFGALDQVGRPETCGLNRHNPISLAVNNQRGDIDPVQIRAEVFNLLNTPNLGAPNGVQGSAPFGTITTALDPRVAQLVVKFAF